VGGVAVHQRSGALERAATAAGIPPARVREVASVDRSFVGAWTGVDASTLWVPRHWVSELRESQLVIALSRRVAVRELGLRRRGVFVAIGWNCAGVALATLMPHADLQTAAGFVTAMLWFTLWSFLGILMLPTISRTAVFAADRWAASSHPPSEVIDTIRQLDAWQDDEAARTPLVERVFHPVPARDGRLRALAGPVAPTDTVAVAPGAWHATRMMLYLSWAGVGGLARAVHCNIGRPSLWVMFPGD
jgi:hypothetical protein